MMTASYSTDGVTWRAVATLSAAVGVDFYAGLAVAAGSGGGSAAAAFDRLSLISVAANAPPLVSLTSPVSGRSFGIGTPVSLTATASDPDDLVSRVDFRVNGVQVASDTAAPYAASWTPLLIGSYSVSATAVDSDGAVTTSAPVSVSVVVVASSTGTGPWRVQFTPSVDHATISGYTMDVLLLSTLSLKVSKNLGKPPIGADGTCLVDVNTIFTALPAGTYQVILKAVASTGTSLGAPAFFTR
jgi:hypothetical protein